MRIGWMLVSSFKSGNCLAPLLLLGAALLHAAPITYTFSGTGTGSLGTTNFTDASFVATLTSDTADVAFVPALSALGIVGLPADIEIAGVGSLNFTGTTFIFTGGQVVGFGEDNAGIPSPPGNLIQINNAALSGYNLASDLTASGANDILSQFQNAATSGGALSFSSMSTVTFQSVVSAVSGVPEPSTIVILGAGLALLALRKKSGLPQR